MGITMLMSTNVFATEMPLADGIDIGYDMEKEGMTRYANHYYNASNFKIGVYLKNGETFTLNNAGHAVYKPIGQYATNDSSTKVTISYQIIDANSGNVRSGYTTDSSSYINVYGDAYQKVNPYLSNISGIAATCYGNFEY